MKIIRVLIFSVIPGIFIFSCSKSNSSSSNSNSTKVKTYTEDVRSTTLGNSVTTYNLNYDASGRILSMLPASGSGIKQVYTYGSGNTYTLDLYNGAVLNVHEIFYINGQSLIDSSFQYNNTNDTSTEKYIYDSNNLLIKYKNYNYSTASGSTLTDVTNYQLDSYGNTVDATDYNSVINYSYYSNLANTLDLGQVYKTKSYNLIQTTTYTSASTGSFSATESYGFDSQSRLIKDTSLVSTGDTLIRSYTY